MGYYAMRPRLAQWVRESDWGTALHLTATTTADAEEVTLTRMTLNIPGAIYWGDGTVTSVAANDTTAKSHTYATAGTYKITVPQATHITNVRIDNAKIGGLNTAELRHSPMDYFYLMLATGCTIDSADMVAWRPTYWYLYSMPAGTYAIDSAGMVDWRPSTWYLSSMPAGTYAIDSADMVDWRPTYCYLFSMPAASSSYTFAASVMRNWTAAIDIRCNDLGLSEAAVNTIVHDIWSGKATYTYAAPRLYIGGTNANPSGVYQAVCPPTSGLEEVYDLVNGNCTADGPEWAVDY